MEDKIHHYTSINILALILNFKTIRFNRLDRVDDISEANSTGKYKLGQYIFVSCWTDDQNESIPQWNMYTPNMQGVRITLPKKMFEYKPLDFSKYPSIKQEGKLLSPIPIERMFTDKYLMFLNCINQENFERKVNYVDDPSIYYKNAVVIGPNKIGNRSLKISNVGNFAAYKMKDWKFQNEFRYVLVILPSIPGFGTEKFNTEMPNRVIDSVENGIAPDLNYFDVELSLDAIDNIEITTGPLMTNGDKIIVESLIEKYSKNGIVKNSVLQGTIRTPKR